MGGVLRCPLCSWSGRCYPEVEQADRFAAHVASHSMYEAIIALLRPSPTPVPCEKIGYPSPESAAHALLHTWQTGLLHRRERRTYQCSACGYWHLTSKPSRESEACVS